MDFERLLPAAKQASNSDHIMSNMVRVLPSELRKAVVQERDASQRPVLRVLRTRSIESPLSPMADDKTFVAGTLYPHLDLR